MRISFNPDITFKAISLNKDETSRADDLLHSMDTPAKKEQAKLELVDIFDKHLQKEAKTKAGKLYRQEDFLQRLYLTFLETLENVKALTTENLLKILNDTKPSKDEIFEDYRIGMISINKDRSSSDDRTIETKLSEENILKPKSAVSTEERTTQREEIQKLTEPLSEKEQDILSQRASGKTYNQIANEEGRSIHLIRIQIKQAIAKIQLNNGALPKEYEQLAEEFIKTFGLKLNKKEAIDFIINNIELTNHNIDTLSSNINNLSGLLKIDKKSLIQVALKHPPLFSQKPETINKNIETTAKLLEVDKKLFTQAALKQPQLFSLKPETINKNIKTTAKLLEVDKKLFTQAALKQPQLFSLKPETINKNIETTSKLLEVDKNIFIQTALKKPQLFYLNPETINKNIETTSKLLEVDKKLFIQAALKQSPLFYLKPETINKNIETTSKLLDINKKLFIQAALKQSQLFCQKPETINKNIETISKLLNVDKKLVIKMALGHPSLFYQKPETIVKKVNIIRYYKQIQGINNDRVRFSTHSDKSLYYDILAYLVKCCDGLKRRLKQNEIVEHLKAKNKVYNFTIPKNELADEFIEYVQEFSKSNFGKSIFNIIKK